MIASDRQHTLANEIVLEGIGLHTGENAQLRIAAGDINTGYVFVRKDLEENLKFRRTFRTCQKRGVARHCGVAKRWSTPQSTCSLRFTRWALTMRDWS